MSVNKKAIVVGASSGIGFELAKTLSRQGYVLGLVARRTELLEKLQAEISTTSYVAKLDVSQASEVFKVLQSLLEQMGSVDLVIINSGVGYINHSLDWEKEFNTIEVNVTGFAAVANFAMKYFVEKKRGHIVGISSIAAIRGGGAAPAYNASKAFVSNYLEGLRQKASKLSLPITVTDIQPGFVKTAMAQGEGLFWVASPEKAADQIYLAIDSKKSHAYITRRWRLIAWLLKGIPGFLYNKM